MPHLKPAAIAAALLLAAAACSGGETSEQPERTEPAAVAAEPTLAPSAMRHRFLLPHQKPQQKTSAKRTAGNSLSL